MKVYKVNEDRRPQKLRVIVSPQLDKQIDNIYMYNQNKPKAIFQWLDYIEHIKDYIANPVIAYDYCNRYVHYPNGAIYLSDFNYDVGFIVRDNRRRQSYVYIFRLDLRPQDFGLVNPSCVRENTIRNKIIIKEYQLHTIIRETLKRILLTA